MQYAEASKFYTMTDLPAGACIQHNDEGGRASEAPGGSRHKSRHSAVCGAVSDSATVTQRTSWE